MTKKGELDMVIYNIEEFVINQMFRPYQSLFPNADTPEGVREWERTFNEEPIKIMSVLRADDKLYELVFQRLSKLDITFYKWLNHPLIGVVEYSLKRRCCECGNLFAPSVNYYPNRICNDCLHRDSNG